MNLELHLYLVWVIERLQMLDVKLQQVYQVCSSTRVEECCSDVQEIIDMIRSKFPLDEAKGGDPISNECSKTEKGGR